MIFTNLITALEEFATLHKQVKRLDFGPIDELDIAKNNSTEYPILFAIPSNVSVDKGQVEIELDFIIAQPYFEGDRAVQLQQMLSIMLDLIAYATQSTNQTNGLSGFADLTVISELPISTEPFLVRFDNALIGWAATITFGSDYTNNFCLVPL